MTEQPAENAELPQDQSPQTGAYVDPNSGAAPQPGGFATGAVVQVSEESQSEQAEPPTNAAYDGEVEHNAGPVGPQPGIETDEEAAPVAGSEAGNPAPEVEQAGVEEQPQPESAAAYGATETQAAMSPDAEGVEGDSEDDGDSDDGGGADDGEAKDYSSVLSGNLDEVQKYIDDHPDEKDAVIAAEQQSDRPRKGIVEY